MSAVAERLGSVARRAAAAAADFLLPRRCVACDAALAPHERTPVCGRCWARAGVLPSPTCDRCGHPRRPVVIGARLRETETSCRFCPLVAPVVRAIRSVCWASAGDPGARIVHALKYDGWTAVASGCAERMARLAWPRDVVRERAALVPVPLARDRERERGFNQSAILASALAIRWGVPVWLDALARTRRTETQTRLTPGERLGNVAGAFQPLAGARSRLAGAHVVLVDDVVTTAATLNACALALAAGGARIVSCVTFGRARGTGDRL